MKLLRNRTRLTVLVLTVAIVTLTAACSQTSVGVGVGYQPDDAPVEFSLSFNISPSGAISIAGSVGFVTPIGIFSLRADIETNLQPTPDRPFSLFDIIAAAG